MQVTEYLQEREKRMNFNKAIERQFAPRAPAPLAARSSGVLLTLMSLLAITAFREREEWVNLLIGLWIIAFSAAHFLHHHH